MFFQSKESRGITLLETAGITVVLGALLFMALGMADLYSKKISLERSVAKGLSLVDENPLAVLMSSGGDLSMKVRDEELTKNIELAVREAEKDIEEGFHDIETPSKYRIEALYQEAEVDPQTGAFTGFGLPSVIASRGNLIIDEAVDRKADLFEAFSKLADMKSVDESSALAEPSTQRTANGQGWRYLPQSVLIGMRIIIDTQDTPANLIQRALGDPLQLYDIKAVHLRGGLQ